MDSSLRAAKKQETPERFEELKKIFERCTEPLDLRNQYVHGVWLLLGAGRLQQSLDARAICVVAALGVVLVVFDTGLAEGRRRRRAATRVRAPIGGCPCGHAGERKTRDE